MTLANAAFHPFGVDKWVVSCNWLSAASVAVGGDIWWMLTKERQAWCYLQVKLCDPCLSALCVPPWPKKRYINTLPFLSLAAKQDEFNSKNWTRGWRCFTKHKPHAGHWNGQKWRFFVPADLDLWPWHSNSSKWGPNTSFMVSSSRDISYTNKKSHRQCQQQNLTQFTAYSSNNWQYIHQNKLIRVCQWLQQIHDKGERFHVQSVRNRRCRLLTVHLSEHSALQDQPQSYDSPWQSTHNSVSAVSF